MNATFWARSWRAPGRCAALVSVALLLAVAPGAIAETLEEYLASGKLQSISNPIPINYFLEQAPETVAEADRARAMEQINLALRRQTNALTTIMAGVSSALSGTVTQQAMQQAQQQMSWSSLIKHEVLGHFGINAQSPQMTQRQTQRMEEEMRQGVADPWIRGIESARALERVGDVQAAARFYMNCLLSLPPDWLPDNCLNEILAMGTARAHALLTWISANAESAGFSAGMSDPHRKSGPADNVVWLRAAALRGLGVLAGSGLLTPEQRESALQPLLTYAQGKEHSPYYSAAASALGSARDPRGVGPLHELAGYKKDPRVEEAALRALAVDFHQADAVKQLRGRLDDKSAEVQFAAADALLAAGDDSVYQWARDIVTSRRAQDDTALDLRPRVVRTLVAHPDARSRQALEEILHQGAGNDWLNAWIAVGLLEMGDGAQLEAVRAAIRKSDWGLDRPTLGTAWRKISPFVQLAMSSFMAPVSAQQIGRVIVNMALAERAKAVERANDREVASLQLRFQACEAFAASEDAAAVAELTALIADPQPAVRLSAARALAVRPGGGSLDGLVAAYHADFGAEEGTSRTPEVRAALLRALLNRAPTDPRTRALVQEAALAADPGIRFLGLVAATHVGADRQ